MKRYEQLAYELTTHIHSGLLAKGDRLPSIRTSSLNRNISPSTVFQAYYLLEAQGLITARERSGYFVTGGPTSGHGELIEPSKGENKVAEVKVSDLVFNIIDSARNQAVIPLGSAFPSPLLFPLKALANTMASSIKGMDPWTTIKDLSPGDPELRKQIAIRYVADGIPTSMDEIVITSGALEGLNLSLDAVTQPGDTVLIDSPTFYASLQAIERSGLRAIEVPCHPRAGLDLSAFEAAVERYKPKACWLMTSFQNPTGASMPEASKKELVRIITKHQTPLIEDDVYGELYFSKNKPLPAKAYDKEGWVLHCSSFSKCLAPGFRVGWVSPGRFAKQVERNKLTTSLTASVPAQQTIAAYLAKGGYDRHLRSLRHTLMVNQLKFIQAVERYFPEGTAWCKPEGGYFVWLRLPEQADSLALHAMALAKGISVAPGPMFSANAGFRNFLRLNYGHGYDDRIENALKTLGELISTLC